MLYELMIETRLVSEPTSYVPLSHSCEENSSQAAKFRNNNKVLDLLDTELEAQKGTPRARILNKLNFRQLDLKCRFKRRHKFLYNNL